MEAWVESEERRLALPGDAGVAGRELEVIAALRPFRDANWDPMGLYRRCSPAMKKAMLQLGICHYLSAFRDTETGEITAFDFGPIGLDVTMRMRRRKGGFEGEIRESIMDESELPPHHTVIGRTTCTLDDIRKFNHDEFKKCYSIHENDCRHYVNAICNYAVGSKNENISLNLVRKMYAAQNEERKRIRDATMKMGQHFFEASNFLRVTRVSRTLVASVVALTGFKALRTPLPTRRLLPATAKGLKASSLFATAAGVTGEPVWVMESLSLGKRVSDGVRVGASRAATLCRGVANGTMIGVRGIQRGLEKCKMLVMPSTARRVARLSASTVGRGVAITTGAVSGVHRGSLGMIRTPKVKQEQLL